MKKDVIKVIDIIICSIFTVSVFIEGYYFYICFETMGFKGIQYFFFSIAGFIISILFLILYWLVKYIYKKRKK